MSDPTGWPDEAREAVVAAMAARNRPGTAVINDHQRAADNAKLRAVYLDLTDAALAALAPFVAAHAAALAQARKEGREEAATLVMPQNDPADWTEYARTRAKAAAVIRAKAQEMAQEWIVSQATDGSEDEIATLEQRYKAKARRDALEEAARIAERAIPSANPPRTDGYGNHVAGERHAARRIAAAIRAKAQEAGP